MTITGNVLKPQNVLAKIGTKASDLMKEVSVKPEEDTIIISGGPMTGTKMDDFNFILTAAATGITFLKKEEMVVKPCTRCTKCVNICPASINPVLIRENIDNAIRLKTLEPNKCTKCGLCAYICPSQIRVNTDVYQAIEVISNE